MGDVFLNGQSLKNKGFFVELIPNPEIPGRAVEEVTIPGKSGVAYNDNNAWTETSRQYAIAAVYNLNSSSPSNYNVAYQRLMTWLGFTQDNGLWVPPSSIYYDLSDTYHGLMTNNSSASTDPFKPEKVQRARLNGQIELVDINNQGCQAVVTFSMDPAQYYNETIHIAGGVRGYEHTYLINPYYVNGSSKLVVNLKVYNKFDGAVKIEVYAIYEGHLIDAKIASLEMNIEGPVVFDSVRGTAYPTNKKASLVGGVKQLEHNLIFEGTSWVGLDFHYWHEDASGEWSEVGRSESALGLGGYLEVINKCSTI